MLQKQFISFAALCTLIGASFTHCASSSSSTSAQPWQPVDPTQALIYYGAKELERAYAAIALNHFLTGPVGILSKEQKSWLNELNPMELGRKLYASIPSPESTNNDYLREFIDLFVPQQIQFTAKATKTSEAAVLDNDEVFELTVKILRAQRPMLQAICIVRSLQRETRRQIDIDEVIARQQAAAEIFNDAVERKEPTLTLVEKDENLDHTWNLSERPSETEVIALVKNKRAELRQHASRCACLIS